MKTYAMMILGCKVNDYEATYVRENMNKHFQEVSFKDKADIYLIFTCCVTNMAEAKTRKFIHKARRNNVKALVVAIGCLSQIKGNSDDFKDVDLIIGSNKKDQIVDLILANTKANLVDEKIDNKFEDLYIESYPGKSRSFLKIQDGCNQFCNYCIIPYSRGRERSGNHITILEEARTLSKTSKEIVLTGIHTGRYFDGEYNLYHLLCDLIKIEDIETIRLSSIEVTEISDEIIDLMASSDKLAHHLHIPVQACTNEILKAMNRPYSIEYFMKRISYIRSKIPNISISTDLIVGFPNESDELFKKNIENIKKINFSFIHVFPYSRKQGTVADKINNHISPNVKKQRVLDVIDLQKDITLDYYKSMIGLTSKVLIEKSDNEYSYGYTKEYIYCDIKGNYQIGNVIEVVIDEVLKDKVIAHAVK